jgi:hypothetical protein
MSNNVQAMQHHGVRRLVCVSSTAADPRYDTQGGYIFERVLVPVISHTLGRTMYADLRRMEKLVSSDLDWTILRASGLFEALSVTDYQVTGGFVSGRFTSRTDLADCMVRQLAEEQNMRKALAVATVSGQPSFLKYFLAEGLARKPPELARGRYAH